MIYKFKIIYGGTLESTIKQYVNDENVDVDDMGDQGRTIKYEYQKSY